MLEGLVGAKFHTIDAITHAPVEINGHQCLVTTIIGTKLVDVHTIDGEPVDD